jgi:hypothetical protein
MSLSAFDFLHLLFLCLAAPLTDLTILTRYHDFLVTSELQLGFEHSHSAGIYMVLKEVVLRHTGNSISVNYTVLDAIKALTTIIMLNC